MDCFVSFSSLSNLPFVHLTQYFRFSFSINFFVQFSPKAQVAIKRRFQVELFQVLILHKWNWKKLRIFFFKKFFKIPIVRIEKSVKRTVQWSVKQLDWIIIFVKQHNYWHFDESQRRIKNWCQKFRINNSMRFFSSSRVQSSKNVFFFLFSYFRSLVCESFWLKFSSPEIGK